MADEQLGQDGDDDGDGGGAVAADRPQVMTREERHARDRAAFLAEDIEDASPASGKAKPAKPAPKDFEADDEDQPDDEDEDLDEVEDAVDDEDENLDDDEDEVEDEDGEGDEARVEKDGKGKADAETAKRLEKVRRTEQRARDALKRDRSELDGDRATFTREREAFVSEWKPKLERFETMKGRVNTRALDVLVELGLQPENYEDVAREIFAASPTGAKDPKNKAFAAERASKKELEAKVDALTRKLDERETNEATAAERAAAGQQVEAYLARVEKATSDETPIAKRTLAAMPKKAKAAIAVVAHRLAEKLGRFASPKHVMRVYEAERRRELELLGVDVDAFAKAPPAAAAARGNGDRRTEAKANGPSNGAGKRLQPTREEILAELRAGADQKEMLD